jgi:hypothetical protein
VKLVRRIGTALGGDDAPERRSGFRELSHDSGREGWVESRGVAYE